MWRTACLAAFGIVCLGAVAVIASGTLPQAEQPRTDQDPAADHQPDDSPQTAKKDRQGDSDAGS